MSVVTIYYDLTEIKTLMVYVYLEKKTEWKNNHNENKIDGSMAKGIVCLLIKQYTFTLDQILFVEFSKRKHKFSRFIFNIKNPQFQTLIWKIFYIKI